MRTLFLTISSVCLFAPIAPIATIASATPNALGSINNYSLALADTPEKCGLIESSAKRLSCYDAFFRHAELVQSQSTQAKAKQTTNQDSKERLATANNTNAVALTDATTRSVLTANDRKPSDTESRLANVRAQSRSNASLVTELETPQAANKPPQQNNAAPLNSEALGESPEQLFGAERIQKDDVSIPDEVSFTVSSITENPRKVRTFTFSNNQVWREVSKNRLRVREGDSVTISKGTFTAYYLSKDGVNRKTQVKRIQ